MTVSVDSHADSRATVQQMRPPRSAEELREIARRYALAQSRHVRRREDVQDADLDELRDRLSDSESSAWKEALDWASDRAICPSVALDLAIELDRSWTRGAP